MTQALHDVGFYGPIVAVALSLIGAIVAIALMTRRPVRDRADRGTAVRIGAAYGILVALPASYIVGGFVGAWGGNPLGAMLLAAVVVGLPLVAFALGAALIGYVFLARRRTGGGALTGAVVGPLLLGAIAIVGVGMVQLSKDLRAAEVLESERQAIADRSEGIRVSVSDVFVDLDADGRIVRVRLTAIIVADVAARLEAIPGKWTEPHFVLTPDHGRNVEARIAIDSPPGSPTSWAAGSTTSYALTFDYVARGVNVHGQPGSWVLVMSFFSDGDGYLAETSVEVRA